MPLRRFDVKALDSIVEQMIETVEKSKNDIFQIGEHCREEYESLTKELQEIKKQVADVIHQGDILEKKSREARKRLSDVSRNFKMYTEEQVRQVYEYAHNLHIQHILNQQLEKQLRQRRDDLERRLLVLKETIERSETLVTQISVVSNYLTSDIKDIGIVLEDAKMKQEFGFRILEAQEEERRRLSREIHDGPAQLLANVLIRSDLVIKVFNEQGPDRALNEIRSLKEMIRGALYEVRRIIYDLRPMALDDLGLVPTLKKYLQTVEEYHYPIRIRFVHLGESKRLPPKYEVALFRIIQESVTNALKHAKANEITVKLEIQKDQVTAVVKDDGIGFDPEIKKDGSFGILGMKERVSLIEGNFSIESQVNQGTVVTIRVPVEVAGPYVPTSSL